MGAPTFGGESLPEKILGLHATLTGHNVPYAFGGAIALAYHAEPRATDDIDLNIFVSPDHAPRVVGALDELFPIAERDDRLHQIATRDQTRLLWGATYVDLFFMDTAFHESMATRVASVDFGGAAIAIISAEDLTVCKALFNRPHDWVDIQNMSNIQGPAFDRTYVEHWLRHFVGNDPIVDHFRSVRSGGPPA